MNEHTSTRAQLMNKVDSYMKMNTLITEMIEMCHAGAENGDVGRVFRHDKDMLEVKHRNMLIEILREKHKLSTTSCIEGDNWFIEVRWV